MDRRGSPAQVFERALEETLDAVTALRDAIADRGDPDHLRPLTAAAASLYEAIVEETLAGVPHRSGGRTAERIAELTKRVDAVEADSPETAPEAARLRRALATLDAAWRWFGRERTDAPAAGPGRDQ